ncbi:hypothetical protein OAC94_00985 [Gammaproteobacteria bacterium]|nr:hypothetical protein [Gammaproteobacteria bacterium]
MKFKTPFQSATQRLLNAEAENSLYEKAASDIEANIIDKGLWTKAFAEADGNEIRQKALYIKMIVRQYKDEILAGAELAAILASEEEKRQRQTAWAAEDARRKKQSPEDIAKKKEAEKSANKAREDFQREQRERDAELRR